MNNKKERGEAGENLVCEYLEQNGATVLKRNYRQKCGEIDIIAKHNETLMFVEVKTRKKGSMIRGIQAIDYKKQNKIVKTAEIYLMNECSVEMPLRFDVAEVEVSGTNSKITYYPDAFDGTTKGFGVFGN
ncbi:MAG: YraN family protein [Oscillospiraceae bacterium]|nr:YraN family protein [Oscillospiraceae bacterium]